MKHGAFKHIIVVAEYFYQCNETFAKLITIEGKNDCDIYFGWNYDIQDKKFDQAI